MASIEIHIEVNGDDVNVHTNATEPETARILSSIVFQLLEKEIQDESNPSDVQELSDGDTRESD